MTNKELLQALLAAENSPDAQTAVEALIAVNPSASWRPVGNRENNRGIIEVSADPGRSAIERVTNAVDAVLEREHDLHGGHPRCRSPREAASSWLNVPTEGLSKMTAAERRDLAKRVTVVVSPGDNKQGRLLEIRDLGVGLDAEEMPRTILSLNESNKMTKHYLAGAYGQGGSSTFVSSALTVIASRKENGDVVAFTVVKYRDLPAEQYKTGHYVYLTVDDTVLEATIDDIDLEVGTLVRHFGYDLSQYNGRLGPNSVYGLLNKSLFDPVMPIWLDDRVQKYRRVIKGSRNALNGAVDEGDEGGASLAHHMPMLYVPLGENGRIGIEYWVLEKATKTNREPTAPFVNPARPILLTLNGQSQEELTALLLRRDAELPYLAKRVIVHVDCNNLEPAALRALFVSNREGARRGTLLETIKEELIQALRSDDELTRLNKEAKAESQKERDETAVQEARKLVAKMLRLHGLEVSESGPNVSRAGSSSEASAARGMRAGSPAPEPIELRDPPTFIRIIWDPSSPVTFYGGQRRYLRIETDAQGHYHNPNDSHASRINFIISDGELTLRSTTALQNGRMRAVFDCPQGAKEGGKGTIRLELSRPGLTSLSDSREFLIVAAPPTQEDSARVNLPPFDVQPVSRTDDTWEQLDWPDNVAAIASSANTSDGSLTVYYNSDFPAFKSRYDALEKRNPLLAASFKNHYEIWLVVHSLLFQHQQDEQRARLSAEELSDAQSAEHEEQYERAERIRVAALSAIVASREIEAAGPEIEAELVS